MKKKRLVMAVAGLALLLGGCAFGGQIDTTTISVDKKGVVTETIVESFEKDYYDITGLETMVSGEITTYNNAAGSEAVKLKSCEEMDTQQVKVTIEYVSSNDYTNMNDRELFCGTVSDAYSAGYEFTAMKSEDGQSIEGTKILELGEKGMVISEEALSIRVPGKIVYVSEGVNMVGENTAVLPDDGDKLSYIIYE